VGNFDFTLKKHICTVYTETYIYFSGIYIYIYVLYIQRLIYVPTIILIFNLQNYFIFAKFFSYRFIRTLLIMSSQFTKCRFHTEASVKFVIFIFLFFKCLQKKGRFNMQFDVTFLFDGLN